MSALKSILKISMLSIAWIFATGLGQTSFAQDTLLVNYQGRLTDSSGEPLTGTYAITFRIFNASVAGDLLWEEIHSDEDVSHGFLNLVLGAGQGSSSEELMAALTPDPSDADRFLEIQIGTDPPIQPRTRLVSTPYAFASYRVSGDIRTAPGVLQIHPPDPCVPPDPCQPALEMVAEPDTRFLRVHPPDPCVPPEPCAPALELIADTEVHSLKIYPPDPCQIDPCTPAMEVTSETSAGVTMSAYDDNGRVMAIGPIVHNFDHSMRLFDPLAAPGGDSLLSILGSFYDETGGFGYLQLYHTGANLKSEFGPGYLRVQHGSFAGGEGGVIGMSVTSTGGKLGIGTDLPAEALDVRGTAKVGAFKMPTDPADGHVLTSDAEGNGTWQAAGLSCANTVSLIVDHASTVRIAFPVTFADASRIDLAASAVVTLAVSGTGFPARITNITITETYADLRLHGWNGVSYVDMAQDDVVQVSYTAIER